ncbi:7125_t:CDS:1, partial [Cetraspora pellucida]
ADILYMPYDKIEKITYKFCLNVVDIVSRYKSSILIRDIIPNIDVNWLKAKDVNLKNILTSYAIAIVFKKIYNDPTCSLIYPKLLLTDKGSEFRRDCERLMKKYSVKIQKANSKHNI